MLFCNSVSDVPSYADYVRKISIMNFFEDHGLPLVQLKEQRRELVVALMGRKDPISKDQIAEIASLQQAIAAIEAVVVDLDAQIEFSPRRPNSLRLLV
jgi:hypothetical protein